MGLKKLTVLVLVSLTDVKDVLVLKPRFTTVTMQLSEMSYLNFRELIPELS